MWKGGKPVLWLSMLSTFCYFHGLERDSKLPKSTFLREPRYAVESSPKATYGLVVRFRTIVFDTGHKLLWHSHIRR
jgi:hypothetical protein